MHKSNNFFFNKKKIIIYTFEFDLCITYLIPFEYNNYIKLKCKKNNVYT